jgi:hypothetical protein
MKSKLVYPGGWIRTTYAHSAFGNDVLQPCVECGRITAGTVWIHEFDGMEPTTPERRVVRCLKHEPSEVTNWDEAASPSLTGAWIERYG